MASYEVGSASPLSGAFAPLGLRRAKDVEARPTPLAERIKASAELADRYREGADQGRDLSRTEPQDARRPRHSGDLGAAELALKT